MDELRSPLVSPHNERSDDHQFLRPPKESTPAGRNAKPKEATPPRGRSSSPERSRVDHKSKILQEANPQTGWDPNFIYDTDTSTRTKEYTVKLPQLFGQEKAFVYLQRQERHVVAWPKPLQLKSSAATLPPGSVNLYTYPEASLEGENHRRLKVSCAPRTPRALLGLPRLPPLTELARFHRNRS